MTKTFEQLNQSDPKSLMILDSLNLAFRYKHSKAVDFATDYMRTVESLQKSYKTKKLIIAGDMGASSYRKALYPLYKQNRKDKYANQTEEEAAEFEAFFEEVQVILSTVNDPPVQKFAFSISSRNILSPKIRLFRNPLALSRLRYDFKCSTPEEPKEFASVQ
jgi:hypothetical protein